MNKWPQFNLPIGHVGVFDPRAGVLDPELAITKYLDLAETHGANIIEDAEVLDYKEKGDSVEIILRQGNEVQTIEAG